MQAQILLPLFVLIQTLSCKQSHCFLRLMEKDTIQHEQGIKYGSSYRTILTYEILFLSGPVHDQDVKGLQGIMECQFAINAIIFFQDYSIPSKIIKKYILYIFKKFRQRIEISMHYPLWRCQPPNQHLIIEREQLFSVYNELNTSTFWLMSSGVMLEPVFSQHVCMDVLHFE